MNHPQAVFGYGSLANRESLELTLGRPADTLPYVFLRGWQREWNVAFENSHPQAYFSLTSGGRPPFVVALNLTRTGQSTDPGVNGVLVGVSDEELQRMDRREYCYDRVNVTADVSGDHGFERIYAYVAKAGFVSADHPSAIIPASYVQTVEAGFRAAHPEALELFRQTTAISNYPLAETKFTSL